MTAALATVPVLRRSFRAMASPLTLAVVEPTRGAPLALDRAEAVVRDVERTCSRFDPRSPLSQANAEPDRWHTVPRTLATAVREAATAHRTSGGLFDPRVHDVLVGWGYDRSLPFADGARTTAGATGPASPSDGSPDPDRWEPDIVRRGGRWRLHLRGRRIDLGGIGKGLAARWAAAELADAGGGSLVDAGGDCVVRGRGPQGAIWRVAVEDPTGAAEPILVLAVSDAACATSSTRLRRWRADGTEVHHLVDPRTRRPGGGGLLAVTVVGQDPAAAEVLTKVLFLAGADGIERRLAELGHPAAAWVTAARRTVATPALDSLVTWRADHA